MAATTICKYNTIGGKKVVTCDVSSDATVAPVWDFSSAHDSTTLTNHLHIHTISVVCEASVSWGLLDNTTDYNYIIHTAQSDVSGLFTNTWEFNPPIDLTMTEATALYVDSSLVGLTPEREIFFTITYDWG